MKYMPAYDLTLSNKFFFINVNSENYVYHECLPKNLANYPCT